jgi:hypothetical protein
MWGYTPPGARELLSGIRPPVPGAHRLARALGRGLWQSGLLRQQEEEGNVYPKRNPPLDES